MALTSSGSPCGGLQDMVNEVEVISSTVNSVGAVSGSLIKEERDRNTCS